MADRCTTADCPHDAVTLTTRDGVEGYYPYCESCAEILLRGGEEEHPQMARKRAEKRDHFEQVCAERDRYHGTLQAIAQYVDEERTPQVDWILDRAQEAFETANTEAPASTRKQGTP